MSTPEGLIVKAVLDYLAARHVLAFRMNSGAMKDEYLGKLRFIRFGVPGCADILAFPEVTVHCAGGCRRTITAPLPVWLECKTEKGKQSELQASFEKQVTAAGHLYAIVRSIEDAKKALKMLA